MARIPAYLLTLCLAAWPAASGAQPAVPDGAKGAAAGDPERTYRVAQEHYKAGRYAAALELFRRLAEEQQSPNARLYVARCLRELGRLPAAFVQMRTTLREAAAREASEPRFAGTRQAAQGELEALRARIGLLEVRPSSWPPGLTVEIGGRRFDRPALADPVAVLPGRVHLRAVAPGYQPARTTLDVSPGSSVLVPLVMRELGPSSVPAAAEPAATPVVPPRRPAEQQRAVPPANNGADDEPLPAEAPSEGPSGTVIGGFAFAGLGTVGWIVMAVAGTMADDRFEEIEGECGGVRCTDPAINDSIEEGRVMDYVANAGLGVGVVGFVTAGVLFAIELSGSSQSESAQPAEQTALRVRSWPVGAGQVVGVAGGF